MKKYEIYLPLKYNDGTEIEAEKIKQIREELIAVFGALTVGLALNLYAVATVGRAMLFVALAPLVAAMLVGLLRVLRST